MGSLRVLFDRQHRYIMVAIAMLIAIAIPAFVSAAQLTERSIELSSSSKKMAGVTYDVQFTTDASATGFVIDFCQESPLIGQECTAPVGFDVSSATSSNSTKDGTNTTDSKFVGTKTMTNPGPQTITLEGVTNPDNAGAIYARILTFNGTGQETYTSQTPGEYVDNGSVAISITDTIGVSGAVLESLTFCVAGDSGTVKTNEGIAANCGDAATNAPTVALGEDIDGVVALVPSAVSEGTIYAQISTNAVNGAIVRLKSSAEGCGGLLRAGAAPGTCNIGPATAGITAGDALFGVKVAAASDPTGVTPTGTFQATNGYASGAHLMNFTSGASPASGVTSIYGDQIMNTNSAPVNNKNMKLTFGASVGNNTPAGLYSADFSLIATGTF